MRSLLQLLALSLAGPGDFDVVINEIHYHPFGNDGADEFVEIHNRGPIPVDLSLWRLGSAVVFSFPEGTVLPGGGYAVVSPDPKRTAGRYGVADASIFGPWAGRLDNDGDVLELHDPFGRRIARTRYRDGAGWPAAPDGLGPSLELISPRRDFDFPEGWAASARPGGTPGERNSRWSSDEVSRDVLFGPGNAVRYFRGRAEPSAAPPLAWAKNDFDEGGWEIGSAPVGYGVTPLGTTLADMQGGYTSVYVRAAFSLDAADLPKLAAGEVSLIATVRYDDGFVAYAGGAEVTRANVAGIVGEPVPFAGISIASEQASRTFSLPVAAPLRPGRNILALHGFNRDRDTSGDFLLDLTIERVRRASPENPIGGGGPVINEIAGGSEAGQGLIEVMNPTSDSLSLDGYRLTDDPFRPDAGYRFPAGPPLAPGGFLAVPAGDLGFAIPLEEACYLLLRPDGSFQDGLEARLGPLAASWGRFPDGGRETFALTGPSPGAANSVELTRSVVINEIHYHPKTDPGDPGATTRGEFVELFNAGAAAVSLKGWRFARGIDYRFPDDVSIAAGGFLVVAADPEYVRGRYGLPAGAVAGGHLSRLANDAETIRLEDPRRNLADEVRYADDGVWPLEADGQGPSLELANPALANEAGGSWRAGPAGGPAGGTPGAPNASFEAAPVPVIYSVRHFPPVPRRGEPIRVEARVSSIDPLRSVRLSYRTERGTGQGIIELRDDGLSGDGSPGDGLWGATIPAPVPADGQAIPRVAFTIAAEDTAGRISSAPRGGRDFLVEAGGDGSAPNSNPRYRLIMTAANWNELRTRGSASNVLLDATFVGDGQVFYNVGVRFRGNGARNPPDGRFSYRVQLRDERRFNGIRKLNLNSQRIGSQVIGNDLVRRSGLPSPQVWPANLWLDGALDAGYLRVESMDGDFLARSFQASEAEGNLYRAHRGGGNRQGDLRWYGADPALYPELYEKATNDEVADWSDIIRLSDLLNNTPDAEYAAMARTELDVAAWCRYFALYALLGSTETGIYRDDGDDYYLYRRSSDGRWMLFPWDQDSDFTASEATQPLFRPSSPPVRRLLTHPEFAPVFYCTLEELIDGPFSRPEVKGRFPLIEGLAGPVQPSAIDSYVVARHSFLATAIPGELTVGIADPGSAASTGELIKPGDRVRYYEGTTAVAPGWERLDFDDAAWSEGAGPIGQGYNDLGTAVGAQGSFLTLFARRSFSVEDPAAMPDLLLDVGYDDGVVAYLNGEEVARANLGARGQPVAVSDSANAGHDGYPREPFVVPASKLRAGKNVLAVVVANNRISSGDLLLDAILTAGVPVEVPPGGGCGGRLDALGDQVVLEGTAPGCATRSVKVNGSPAQYDPVTGVWRADLSVQPGPQSVVVEAFDPAGSPIARQEVAVQGASGFRSVEGTLAAGAVWTREEGPYFVSGNLDVPAGASLTIGAGSVVRLAPGAVLTVAGLLAIDGTAEKPVLFQPVRCGERWSGIRLMDTGAAVGAPVHRIRSAVLSGASGAGGALEVQNARAEVAGSLFEDIATAAIGATGSSLAIEDCRFRNLPSALRAGTSAVTMRNCSVSTHAARVPAVSIDGGMPGGSWLESLELSGPVDAGVLLRNAEATVLRCRIRDCGGAALQVEGGKPAVRESLLSRSGVGLSVFGGECVADHVTIAENRTGLAAAGSATVRVESSIVWGNGADVGLSGGSAAFAYSDVGSSEPLPGEGNIAADPRFASPGVYDLAPGSPAAGAGKGGTDMGAIQSPDASPRFTRGDYLADGQINLTDVIVLLSYLFLGGAPEPCEDAGDMDDSGILDLSDSISNLNYQFLGGAPPPAPFPEPGRDLTPDSLTCRK